MHLSPEVEESESSSETSEEEEQQERRPVRSGGGSHVEGKVELITEITRRQSHTMHKPAIHILTV